MEKVLITGIGGFIGKNLAFALRSEGYKVYGISKSKIRLSDIVINQVNILDEDAVVEICKDKDYIIHLAAVTEHGNISDFPIESLKTNVIGTYNILHGFLKSKAKSFIFPSSGKVYGEAKYLPYDESHPTNPETSLGKIKKICEDLTSYFNTFSDKSFSILRIFNVYGHGQKKYFLIPTILSQINNDKIILGDVHSKRDYLYIKDLVSCFLTIMRHKHNGLKVYNVGSGVSYSAYDIVNTIGKIKNKKFEIGIDKTKLRKNEESEEKANIKKLNHIGWKPKYSLEKGLREIIDISKL